MKDWTAEILGAALGAIFMVVLVCLWWNYY